MKNANENNWSGIESIIDRKLGLTSDVSPISIDALTSVEKFKYLIDVQEVLNKDYFATKRGNIEINNKRAEGDFVAGTVELFNL